MLSEAAGLIGQDNSSSNLYEDDNIDNDLSLGKITENPELKLEENARDLGTLDEPVSETIMRDLRRVDHHIAHI